VAKGEIHVELSVNFADDPKVRALARYGKDARAVRDLWVQMLCHCKESLTDGFVSKEQLGILVYPDPPKVGQRDAERLADVGLIERVDGGYHLPTFLKRNKSRDQVHARMQQKHDAGVLSNHRRWHENRGVTDPTCDHCSVAPPIGVPIAPPIGTPTTDRIHIDIDRDIDRDRSTKDVGPRKRGATTKGTRVPDPFPLDGPLKAWFAEHCPNLDGRHEHERFMDYWRGVAGAKGLKHDWPATWRNWMRRAAEERPGASRALAPTNGAPRPSTTDQRVTAALAVAEKYRLEDNG
jgi:hypothetical protein